MRSSILLGFTSFLVGVGVRVLGTTLLQPNDQPVPESTAAEAPADAAPAYAELPAWSPAAPQAEKTTKSPRADPQRDLERMSRDPEGERPSWWDGRD